MRPPETARDRERSGPLLPKPWPRRPPAGARCDAAVGAQETSTDRMPTIARCPKPARETCWWGQEAWLCEEHADVLAARGVVARNPKRRTP